MIRFLDGPSPARGAVLILRRVPICLRVVTKGSEVDALDQLDDTPRPGEHVLIYVRIGDPGWCHIKHRCRSKSGWYLTAEYRYFADAPHFHDNAAWQSWVEHNWQRVCEFRGEQAAAGEGA